MTFPEGSSVDTPFKSAAGGGTQGKTPEQGIDCASGERSATKRAPRTTPFSNETLSENEHVKGSDKSRSKEKCFTNMTMELL